MQQCNCTNTYKYPNGPDGTPICVVCGEDWPEDSDYEENLKDRAKLLYYMHIRQDANRCHYMWEQCSKEYKDAWLTIAKADLE